MIILLLRCLWSLASTNYRLDLAKGILADMKEPLLEHVSVGIEIVQKAQDKMAYTWQRDAAIDPCVRSCHETKLFLIFINCHTMM